MPSMPTLVAIVLAFNLTNAGKPAKAIKVSESNSIVIMEGRPGCYAEAANKDPNNPVIYCKNLKK